MAPFEEPGTLINAVEFTEGKVLIVVEDAMKEDTKTIFEVLDYFKNHSNVRFLFDSRKSDWESEDFIAGDALLARYRNALKIVEMPALDEQECIRAIEHFQKISDSQVEITGDQLYEKIRGANLGGPLVLAYWITGPVISDEPPVSALHADVYQAYDDMRGWQDGGGITIRVALLLNILNMAELPSSSPLIHSLAGDRDDHRRIDRTLGFLEGTLLEQSEDEFRLPHQLWSALFIEHHIDEAGERLAKDQFEECIGSLFRFIDSETCRERIRSWFRDNPDIIERVEDDQVESASWIIENLASIGQIKSSIGLLWGTPSSWRVSLPDCTPVKTRIRWYRSRARTHVERGAFDAAREECEAQKELIHEADDQLDDFRRHLATSLDNIGVIAWKQGELERAKKYHTDSLEIVREINYEEGEARALANLGVIAHKSGNFDKAREVLEEALELSNESGYGKGMILTNLGHVAQKRGNLQISKEYYEESMQVARNNGDRSGIAASFDNLGNLAQRRGNLDEAEAFQKKSLALCRELGDRHSEAQSQVNLGALLRSRGNLVQAEERVKTGLEIFREIGAKQGAARALGNLGNIARHRGRREKAREYHKECLKLNREIGDLQGLASNFGSLGNLCLENGNSKDAVLYFAKSLSISRKIGDRHGVANSLVNLGQAASSREDFKDSKNYFKLSIRRFKKIGMKRKVAHTLSELGDVHSELGEYQEAVHAFAISLRIFRDHQDQRYEGNLLEKMAETLENTGELKGAKRHYERALDIYQEMNDPHLVGHSIGYIGLIERSMGNPSEAKERLRSAIEVLNDSGNPGCTLHLIESLVDLLDNHDEYDAAREWWKEGYSTAEAVDDEDSLEVFENMRSKVHE